MSIEDRELSPKCRSGRINMDDPVERAAWEAAEAAAGMARFAIATNNPEEFEAAWRAGRGAVVSATGADLPIEETPLAMLLPTRIANAMEESAGLRVLGDLAGLTFEEFRSIPNMGHKSWERVQRCAEDARQRRDRQQPNPEEQT